MLVDIVENFTGGFEKKRYYFNVIFKQWNLYNESVVGIVKFSVLCFFSKKIIVRAYFVNTTYTFWLFFLAEKSIFTSRELSDYNTQQDPLFIPLFFQKSPEDLDSYKIMCNFEGYFDTGIKKLNLTKYLLIIQSNNCCDKLIK